MVVTKKGDVVVVGTVSKVVGVGVIVVTVPVGDIVVGGAVGVGVGPIVSVVGEGGANGESTWFTA